MAESTPELRIKGVIDLSGVRQELASLQGQAGAGIAVGGAVAGPVGTFAGEAGRTTATAGIAAPIPVTSIATGIFQSPQPAPPLEPPSMRMLQVAAFQERISNPQALGGGAPAAASTGSPMEAVGPTLGGGGSSGGNPLGYFGRAFFALHELREFENLRRGVSEAQSQAAGASTRSAYYKAEARRFGALQQGLVAGTLSEIDDVIEPNYSPRAQQERAEAYAEISDRNRQNYGMFLSTANERDIRLAGSRGSYYERRINQNLTRIRVGGESEQAQLRFQASELDRNVQSVIEQAGGYKNLRPAQKLLVQSNIDQANALRDRAVAIGEDTVDSVKRAKEDERFAQTMQAQGLSTGLAAGRLRMRGHTGVAGIVAAYGRGIQMIGEASRTGDEEVQRLTAETAGLGVQEAVGDVVRGGAASIAQWVRRRTAEGNAARRDVMHTAELQAQQGVAELQANRQPVAAGIAGILADTKLAVAALKTDDPEYTRQRDALRGIGVARLRAFQNSLADASQAVEVAPGTIAPGAGQGRVGAGGERDIGKQIADAVKEMGAGGNATGDARGNIFEKLGRVADGLERFLGVVTGG